MWQKRAQGVRQDFCHDGMGRGGRMVVRSDLFRWRRRKGHILYRIYGDIASRCLDLHKAFPQMRGVFDPANYVQCGQETWSAWEELNPYIDYLHIKDALADGSVVPAGKGLGNVKRILDAYRAQGGEDVTVEPHLQVFEGLKDLEQDGNTSHVGGYRYPSSDAAFDAACNALKEFL